MSVTMDKRTYLDALRFANQAKENFIKTKTTVGKDITILEEKVKNLDLVANKCIDNYQAQVSNQHEIIKIYQEDKRINYEMLEKLTKVKDEIMYKIGNLEETVQKNDKKCFITRGRISESKKFKKYVKEADLSYKNYETLKNEKEAEQKENSNKLEVKQKEFEALKKKGIKCLEDFKEESEFFKKDKKDKKGVGIPDARKS